MFIPSLGEQIIFRCQQATLARMHCGILTVLHTTFRSLVTCADSWRSKGSPLSTISMSPLQAAPHKLKSQLTAMTRHTRRSTGCVLPRQTDILIAICECEKCDKTMKLISYKMTYLYLPDNAALIDARKKYFLVISGNFWILINNTFWQINTP